MVRGFSAYSQQGVCSDRCIARGRVQALQVHPKDYLDLADWLRVRSRSNLLPRITNTCKHSSCIAVRCSLRAVL